MAEMQKSHIRRAFDTATAGAAGSLVVLIGFLAATWNDTQAALSTLAAIEMVALALTPYVFITIVESFAGQRTRLSSKWERNYKQSIAAFLVLVLVPWLFGLIRWYIEIGDIIGSRSAK